MNILKNFFLRGWLALALLIVVSVSLVWALTPSCPSGYVLTSDRTKCVREAPRNVCPENYTLSGGYCRHTNRQSPVCPSGTRFDSASHNCTDTVAANVTCPEGYTDVGSKCVSKIDPIITCPEGYNYTTLYGGKCVAKINPSISCPSGYHRSGALDRDCLRSEIPTCPSGFNMNTQGSLCTSVVSTGPTCPAGTTYNASKHVCEDFANPSCPANYRLMNGECVSTSKPTYQ